MRFVSLSIEQCIRRAHLDIRDAGLTNVSVLPRVLGEFADLKQCFSQEHRPEGEGKGEVVCMCLV